MTNISRLQPDSVVRFGKTNAGGAGAIPSAGADALSLSGKGALKKPNRFIKAIAAVGAFIMGIITLRFFRRPKFFNQITQLGKISDETRNMIGHLFEGEFFRCAKKVGKKGAVSPICRYVGRSKADPNQVIVFTVSEAAVRSGEAGSKRLADIPGRVTKTAPLKKAPADLRAILKGEDKLFRFAREWEAEKVGDKILYKAFNADGDLLIAQKVSPTTFQIEKVKYAPRNGEDVLQEIGRSTHQVRYEDTPQSLRSATFRGIT